MSKVTQEIVQSIAGGFSYKGKAYKSRCEVAKMLLSRCAFTHQTRKKIAITCGVTDETIFRVIENAAKKGIVYSVPGMRASTLSKFKAIAKTSSHKKANSNNALKAIVN